MTDVDRVAPEKEKCGWTGKREVGLWLGQRGMFESFCLLPKGHEGRHSTTWLRTEDFAR